MTEICSLEGISFPSSSQYTILEEIGRGGMGIVFLAEKDSEGVVDHVVLKTLRVFSQEQEDRLRNEANVATGLRHENIVKCHGLEAIPLASLPAEFRRDIEGLSFERAHRRRMKALVPGKRFQSTLRRMRKRSLAKAGPRVSGKRLHLLVMDYVEGTDLRTLVDDLLRRDLLLPCPIGAFIISRIARALGYAHQFLVHRDVTPENLLVNRHGVAKLSDFGVAHSGDEEQRFAGKVAYMAPEQVRRQQVGPPADIYALGLCLYEVLTGIRLHKMPPGLPLDAQVEQAKVWTSQVPPSPRAVRGDIPEILSAITMKMLEVSVEKRYARAEDVALALERQYLYAEGFGPTNNALAAYIEISDANFQTYSQDQLRQLVFLKDETGKIQLRRGDAVKGLTTEGRELVRQRPGTWQHARLFGGVSSKGE